MKRTGFGVVAAVLFTSLPFFTFGHLLYGDVNSKALLVTAVTGLLILFAAYRMYVGKLTFSLKGRWLLGALGLVMAVQYASAFMGVYLERSLWSDIFWSSGVFFLTHLAVLAVLLGEFLNKSDWSLIRRGVAISSGIFGVLTIIGVQGLAAVNQILWVNLGSVSLTLGNETYAGAYLLLAFVVGLIELFETKKESPWRNVLLASLVGIATSPLLFNIGLLFGKTPVLDLVSNPTLLLGTARASSAALFAILAFMAGKFVIERFGRGSGKGKAVLAWGALFVATLGVGIALLFSSGSVVQNAYIETSTAARIIVWDAGFKAFQDRPLLGWGPENFNYGFEANFDNRIFQEDNLAEIWFERAHNVFIDTLVTNGVVGFVSFALLTLVFFVTVYRARKKELLSDTHATLLGVFVFAHVLQMQTGFDTVASYTLLALMLAYALYLERQLAPVGEEKNNIVLKGFAVACAILALLSLKSVVLDEYARQTALLQTFTATSAADQKVAIENSLKRTSSFESLRLSNASFIKGSLASIAQAPSDQKTKVTLEFMKIYSSHFETFIAEKPESYRAHINYANLLLLRTVLGDNQLERANEVIAAAYPLAPNHPLTFIMDSVAHLYAGDIEEADALMQKAIAINPNVEFTQNAAAYLEKQKKQFPNISVLRIGNL